MSHSVFIISTASQAFFLDKANIIDPKSILITTTSDKNKSDKILDYLSEYDWFRIFHWQIPKSANKIEYWKIVMIQILTVLFKIRFRNKINEIYIGSYANLYHKNFASHFPNLKHYNLIYDGLQVLSLNDNRINSKKKFKELPVLYKILGYRNPDLKSLKYIVPFEFEVSEPDSIEVFNIEQNETSTYDYECIYFIGQPLEKIKAVSPEFYLDHLKKFISENPDKKVFYIPHPRELKDKLNQIAKFCNILNPNKVFEEYFLKLKKKPSTIVSFYSSVLVNILAIDKNVKIISIQIPESALVHPRFKKHLEPIYTVFKNISEERFQVINVELN